MSEAQAKPRYSIITAVCNQLPANQLFYESLKKYSKLPFELIIIDNASTDGSREYFQSVGATVICNSANYSYPYNQNQGAKAATTNLFFFLNNDLILSKDWDERSLELIDKKALDFFSWATPDRIESEQQTKKLLRKWKRIKYPLLYLFGAKKSALSAMHKAMYGDWEKYTEKRFLHFADKTIENFSGSAVGMTREAFSKLGPWDERIQAADFDLFLRIKARQKTFQDVKPMTLLLGVFLHHFQRLSFKGKAVYAPFEDAKNMISFDAKWQESDIAAYVADLKK